eukprot:gene446-1847_t
MSYRVTLQLAIDHGLELPKADRLSEIDPYVKVFNPSMEPSVDSGAPVSLPSQSTADIDDDPNPEWNEQFFFPVEMNEDGWMQGLVRLELWDKENVVDEFCGFCTVDLSVWPAELPLGRYEYADKTKKRFQKQKRNSRIVVRLVGTVLCSEDLMHQLGPDCTRTADGGIRVYAPIYDSSLLLYAAIHYSPRGMNFSICACEKGADLHLDISYHGGDCEEDVTVARQTYQNGKKLFPGAVCFSECVVMGMPLSIDFDQLVVSVEDRRVKDSIGVEALLDEFGWPGPTADFDTAADCMEECGAFADVAGIYIKLDAEETASSEARSKPKRTSNLLWLDYGTGPDGRMKIPGLPPAESVPGIVANTAGGQGPPMLQLCTVRKTTRRVNPGRTVHCAEECSSVLNRAYNSSRNFTSFFKGEEIVWEEEEEEPEVKISLQKNLSAVREGVTAKASRAKTFIAGTFSSGLGLLRNAVSKNSSFDAGEDRDRAPSMLRRGSERSQSEGHRGGERTQSGGRRGDERTLPTGHKVSERANSMGRQASGDSHGMRKASGSFIRGSGESPVPSRRGSGFPGEGGERIGKGGSYRENGRR